MDKPRTLRESSEIGARRALLKEPHVRPLTEYVSGLRTKYIGWEFPDFDPMDGGIDANLLFLFEKPGPMS